LADRAVSGRNVQKEGGHANVQVVGSNIQKREGHESVQRREELPLRHALPCSSSCLREEALELPLQDPLQPPLGGGGGRWVLPLGVLLWGHSVCLPCHGKQQEWEESNNNSDSRDNTIMSDDHKIGQQNTCPSNSCSKTVVAVAMAIDQSLSCAVVCAVINRDD
jgi:hypothetical protein